MQRAHTARAEPMVNYSPWQCRGLRLAHAVSRLARGWLPLIVSPRVGCLPGGVNEACRLDHEATWSCGQAGGAEPAALGAARRRPGSPRR
jgi:hypothetical protein